MEFRYFAIQGVVEILPRVFGDARGAFFESFSAQKMTEAGIVGEWVQDNQSRSDRGVVRGLHFQKPPYTQAKLVRVAQGRALDVIVDIRRDSPTYGQHLMVELDSERYNMLYVPPGFAHGFTALEDNTLFLYKCTNYYAPQSEGGLLWNDPTLGIQWGVENPTVSAKDQILPTLAELDSPF
ncbi:dTDP-4-dehydrorhamnose 3,5-epimerase [Hymenobacter luteus]|uniref:dTDP-4-dehydrorhamnose 3,5-epimerase n=2 Tax=Hymenobacter TaxID=89966 RepID=A0A7W9SXV8_9BACT|nr:MULTISPECIES: dTDP-4-dehydrorhamnose 3,5-epimerase [Hymenobacter]MBB4599780.1 dTDP-4-dehydrorhamnose 3,5-epimerase [Hymenobacter latericoloratus]MBB6057910.1 dTDP-4-dehydrorhamnose 3,5-epimerase [Hymenobacter luteus]